MKTRDTWGLEQQRDANGSVEGPPPFGASRALAPGYEVVEHLHRSNDYDVYEVYSSERSCGCIAKTPRPDRLSERKVRRALFREGELLSSLTHPHIARAYEVLQRPRPAVILETLTGDTLAYLIDESPRRLPLTEVCFLGLHLCSAVRYLHRRGLLHLDLKPSNIVSERGIAKLLDLSIARPPGRARRGVGTRQYMSPEQAAGGHLTAAADVWGLGTVLFEAATGEIPFELPEPENAADDLPKEAPDRYRYLQLERRADPVGRHRRVPASFAGLVEGCLDPDPVRRPVVTEVIEALESLV